MRVAWACLAAAVGCADHVFVCQSSNQCVDGTHQGTCELDSYCSFPDDGCPSQRRYGVLAPSDVAGQCVDAPNAIANGTCDDSTASWVAFQSTVALSTTARTGAHSCLVCEGGNFPDFTMDDDPPSVSSADPGQTFLGTAWFRTAPGSAVPMGVYIEIRDATTQVNNATEFLHIDDTWQQASLMHTVATMKQPVELFVAGKTDMASSHPCFLVDDIALYRVR